MMNKARWYIVMHWLGCIYIGCTLLERIRAVQL